MLQLKIHTRIKLWSCILTFHLLSKTHL